MVFYSKVHDHTDIFQGAEIVTHIRHEINLHIEECKEFGLTQQDMEKYEESQGKTAATMSNENQVLTPSSLHSVQPLHP